MHHAGDLPLIFGLYGDAVAVIAHGDHRILKIGAVGSREHGIQLIVDLLAGDLDAAADAL